MVFTSFDGKQIYVREWTDVERPCGVVQIAHGMEEHAGRYDRFARELNALGYAVVADDHRGHGDTDPDTLGYAPGDMFADTVEDMAGIAQRYHAKFAGVPYVLFGFSYGSFLTQAFIERHAGLLDGAVIAGSSKQKGGMVALGAAVAAIGCAFKGASAPAKLIDRLVFGGYDKKFDDREFLSTDAENNERYYADPFCGFKCSYNFYRSFFRGLKGLYTKESGGAGQGAAPPSHRGRGGRRRRRGGRGQAVRLLQKTGRKAGRKASHRRVAARISERARAPRRGRFADRGIPARCGGAPRAGELSGEKICFCMRRRRGTGYGERDGAEKELAQTVQ